ncbi:hypothetical protein [Desulfurobacterium sp.]
MNWIRTNRGYLVDPDAVESIGIGKKEVTKYVTKKGKQFPDIIRSYVYVVKVRTLSGTTYEVSEHAMYEDAQEKLERLYTQIIQYKEESNARKNGYRTVEINA